MVNISNDLEKRKDKYLIKMLLENLKNRPTHEEVGTVDSQTGQN